MISESFYKLMKNKILFVVVFCWFSQSLGNTFSEVFGSEGAAGIQNPKTRSLSYTLQYLTLSGSIGYVVKRLNDSGFFEPLGFTPGTIKSLSPLAYENNFILDKHTANIISVNEKLDELNYLNNVNKNLFLNRYSSKSIESRNNSNFLNSIKLSSDRNSLIRRYNE
tara:strand:- start:1188 stop:1685 length:498 start_codon:yes stop_codon:yes gene_type:complete